MPRPWETERKVEDQSKEAMQDEQDQSQVPHETSNTQGVYEGQLRQVKI